MPSNTFGTRGDHSARVFVVDLADELANEPSPVFKRAAVLAQAHAPGQEFVQQVAVELLEIDEVEASLKGEPGGLRVTVAEPIELGVSDQRRVGPRGRAPVVLSRIVRGSSKGSCWARIGRSQQ